MTNEPRIGNQLGLVRQTKAEYLERAFNFVTYALQLPITPASMCAVAGAVYDFLEQKEVLFFFVGDDRAALADGYTCGVLRVEGPFTGILRGIGCPPELLLKEEHEETTKVVHYSPQLLIGLHIWYRMTYNELRAAKMESRTPRFMLYTGERQGPDEWVKCPPPLPYIMLPDAYKKIASAVEGRDFKNLGELIDAINKAEVVMGEGNRQVQVWARGPRDTCNHEQIVWFGAERRFGARNERRFGLHWADVVVGNVDVKDVGVVPATVKSEHKSDPALASLLKEHIVREEEKEAMARMKEEETGTGLNANEVDGQDGPERVQ